MLLFVLESDHCKFFNHIIQNFPKLLFLLFLNHLYLSKTADNLEVVFYCMCVYLWIWGSIMIVSFCQEWIKLKEKNKSPLSVFKKLYCFSNAFVQIKRERENICVPPISLHSYERLLLHRFNKFMVYVTWNFDLRVCVKWSA